MPSIKITDWWSPKRFHSTSPSATSKYRQGKKIKVSNQRTTLGPDRDKSQSQTEQINSVPEEHFLGNHVHHY